MCLQTALVPLGSLNSLPAHTWAWLQYQVFRLLVKGESVSEVPLLVPLTNSSLVWLPLFSFLYVLPSGQASWASRGLVAPTPAFLMISQCGSCVLPVSTSIHFPPVFSLLCPIAPLCSTQWVCPMLPLLCLISVYLRATLTWKLQVSDS